MSTRDERVAMAAFMTQALLAGGNAVCVRFSNRELAPLWGAGLRFALATIALAAIVAAMRLPLPRGRALTGALLYGALNFGGAFALVYYGMVAVPAGLGQTLLALVPLATLLLAVAQRQEPLSAMAVVGTVVAGLGVAMMSRAPLRVAVPPLSLAAMLGSVLCFAQAAVLVRRFPRVHPLTMNAIGMATGASLLLSGSVLAREAVVMPRHAATWAAIAYVVPVGSIVVFLLYVLVLRRWAASRVAYGFVITPGVTILLSAWLDDEPLSARLLIGGALVVAGVYLGALRPAASGAPP